MPARSLTAPPALPITVAYTPLLLPPAPQPPAHVYERHEASAYHAHGRNGKRVKRKASGTKGGERTASHHYSPSAGGGGGGSSSASQQPDQPLNGRCHYRLPCPPARPPSASWAPSHDAAVVRTVMTVAAGGAGRGRGLHFVRPAWMTSGSSSSTAELPQQQAELQAEVQPELQAEAQAEVQPEVQPPNSPSNASTSDQFEDAQGHKEEGHATEKHA